MSADLPTPPLPTIITLWRAKELWFLLLLAAIVLLATDEVPGNQSDLQKKETVTIHDTGDTMTGMQAKHLTSAERSD